MREAWGGGCTHCTFLYINNLVRGALWQVDAESIWRQVLKWWSLFELASPLTVKWKLCWFGFQDCHQITLKCSWGKFLFLRWFKIVFRDSIAHATLVYGAIVLNSVQTCVWPNKRPNNNDFPFNVCNIGAFGSEIGPNSILIYSYGYHLYGYTKQSTVLLILSLLFVV